MTGLLTNIQDRVKTGSNAVSLMAFKAVLGLILGLTFALIGDEIVGYGSFSFLLVIVVTTGALMKITKAWTWAQMAVFSLICVLIGLLLRMYILIAPG
jgi:hypothetical protein